MSQWPYEIPPEWAWIKSLREGDVLKARSGKLRIVRRVRHLGPSIPKTFVHLTIQHCSWTGRPYTVVTGNDLRQMGFQRVGNARKLLKDQFSRALARDFEASRSTDCQFKCCDVRGIA